VIFCENAAQLAKVREVRSDVRTLQRVIVFDGTDVTPDEFVITWEQLLSSGDAFIAANPKDFDDHVSAIKPGDLATLVYTSGTTGPPKGSMLTHDNIVWTVHALMETLPSGPEDRRLSYLPLSHIAERQVSHFQ
jgi:long-chain acyl-CoA synthetase